MTVMMTVVSQSCGGASESSSDRRHRRLASLNDESVGTVTVTLTVTVSCARCDTVVCETLHMLGCLTA